MSSESAFVSTTGSLAGQSVTPDELSPRIIVFVAGAQSRVEAAVDVARKLYPGHHLVFVCDPVHCAWLSQRSGESIFIVAQPFNPFGRRASELRTALEAAPIEACVLIVASIGSESFRFRIFALRLRTRHFLLLRGGKASNAAQLDRFTFAALASLTFLLGALRKTERGILVLLARLLPPFDQPLALGLAWLARIRLFLKPSQAVQANNEIVHVIPTIGMGGVQRQLVLLLKNRSSEFHHRVVVMRSEDRFFAPELHECGVRVYYLDSEKVGAAATVSPRQQKRSMFQSVFTIVTTSLPLCCEIIKLTLFLRGVKPRPDIVHCWLLYANLAGSIAARLANMPVVMTSVRNIQSAVDYNYYDPRWQRILERATVPLANIITANASAVATDYRTFTGTRAEKVVTVPNGVDVKEIHYLTPEERAEKRRSLGLNASDVVVGTIARLAKEKDFETFLRAVALARGELPAIRSVIIGRGPQRVHLESFASSLGLVNFVQFLGGRKDVVQLIQCFDVFLLTSIIEGMPNAVMESQLLGVPVVATRAGGTVDLIRDGRTGLLAPIRDYQAVASCIVRLFTEKGLWGKISAAATDQIREGYTIEQLVARTEAVYRDLLDANASRVIVSCAG